MHDKAAMRGAYYEDKSNGTFQGTEREYRRFWRSMRKTLKAPLTAAIIENMAVVQERFPRLQSNFVGILCLTSNPDSVVMWSHYADKHRGIVVEFDRCWSVFAGSKGLRPVNYVRERPLWDEAVYPQSAEEIAQYDAVIFNKNEEWRYESELRQLFILQGTKRRTLDIGRTGYFVAIPPEIIVSVRLGMACDVDTIAKIEGALKNQSLSHVALKRAKPHDREFLMTALDI